MCSVRTNTKKVVRGGIDQGLRLSVSISSLSDNRLVQVYRRCDPLPTQDTLALIRQVSKSESAHLATEFYLRLHPSRTSAFDKAHA